MATSSVPPGNRSRPLSPLAVFAAALALAVVLLGVLAGFGTRFNWWTFQTGFRLLRWAAYGGIAAVLVALLGIMHARGARRGWPLATLALVLGLVVFGIPWRWQARARSLPPIHDITTDTNDPPVFVAVAPLRADAPNPMEYGGPEIAAQQQEAYPDIRPLILDLPPDRAFQRALDAAEGMGWEIVDANAAAGRIEATDQTFWFGFRDDVVIRLTPLDQRTVLDVRSVSRVGRGDVGTNAERIRAYLAEVRAQPG